MGKLTMASNSLPSFLLLALSFLVSGVPARYSPGDYKPDIGDGPPSDYGRPVGPNCHLEQKTMFKDRCEDYDEKTCWTQNEEQCNSYLVNTCTPVVNTGVDRRCFNVTELICELVESVHYRQVEENFHVQSCYTTKDRVCDTVHEIDTTTKDDLQCVELESPNCHMEDKILVDKVCTDTVEFECSPDKKLDNAGYGVKDTVCREIPKHDCYESPSTSATATSSPRMFLSPWRDRTATSSGRKSSSSCPRPSPRRPRSTRTQRTVSKSRGRSATSAKPRPWSRPACGRKGSRASTLLGRNARSRPSSTAIKPRSQRWLRCATIS